MAEEGTAGVATAGAPAAATVAPAAAAAPNAAQTAAPANAPAATTAAVVAPAADSPEAKAAAETAAKATADATAAAKATADADAAAKKAEAATTESARRAGLSAEARAKEDADKATAKAAAETAEKATKLEARRALAPKEYADFTPPEGIQLDAPVITEFRTVARDLGLSQEDAQAIVDRLAPVVAKNHVASVLGLARTASDEWIAKSAIDPEYGGDKFAENSAIAQKTFKLFGTPALEKFLKDSGMGNHPEMVRWAYRIGKLVGPDDKFIGGTEARTGPKSPEESLWPNS